jgi:hypothetical protein
VIPRAILNGNQNHRTANLKLRFSQSDFVASTAHTPHDGLWLVEPHAGLGPIDAKWEEILVIEDGNARWLDDDSPHMRQWAQIKAGSDYGPAR